MHMKKFLTALVVTGGCLLVGPVQAIDFPSSLSSVVKSVTNKGGKFACQKADIFTLDVSLRSFSGELCGMSSSIAAITQIVCPTAVSDFKGSGCDTKGKATLGTQTPIETLKKNLVSDLKSVKDLACLLAPIAPPPADAVLATGCL